MALTCISRTCLLSTPLFIQIRGLKIAVIGSGPAGFYLTQHLLKNERVTNVDMFEKYPVPFGLVRYGVAPDHPEVKNVEHTFTRTAENPKVSFVGNVSIGKDVTLQEIRDAYNAVVLCYGSSRERDLGIPGEKLDNVLSATRFVGWYNGVPHHQDLKVNVDTDSCVIIGHGNVALDCARILVTKIDNGLGKTDITMRASETLKKSKIKKVHVVGRRGPLQVAFTIKELRELTKLSGCRTIIDTNQVEFITKTDLDKMPRSRRRLTELMLKIASESKDRDTSSSSEKECIIHFRLSPLAIHSNDQLEIDFNVNHLEDPLNERSRSVPTNQVVRMKAGLLIKSIGYTTISLDPSIPMDDRKGCIRNEGGRVTDTTGLYCSGWAATGPTGVLVSTMNVSFQVANKILSDSEEGSLDTSEKPGLNEIERILKLRGVSYVSFNDWKKIDVKERQQGEKHGKPREKILSINDLVEASKQ